MAEPFPRLSPGHWPGAVVALLAVAAVVAVQSLLSPWLGASVVPLGIAVLAAAWYSGRRAGLITTAACALLAAFVLPLPRSGLWLDRPEDRAELLVFLLLGTAISHTCGLFHATRQRLRAEQARLRESNAFHGAIAELSTDFAVSARVEPDGTIVPEAVGDGFEPLLGHSLAELRERGFATLVHPQAREDVRPQIQRLLRGHTIDGETRLVAASGRELQMQFRIRPLWDERGRVVRVYGGFRDVTRERLAEQAAREREQQLHLVTDDAPVLIGHLDTAERFKFVNRRYAERFSREPADFPGRTVRELFGAAAYAVVQPHLARALSGTRVEFEADVPYGGGPPLPVRIAYEPERDGTGRVVGVVEATLSTADQRLAQQALRKGEERLRLALHGAHLGTWDWDLASGRVSWDDRCSAIFGWKRAAELTYEDHVDVAHPEDRARLAQAMQTALREGTMLEHEHRVLARDGALRWVEVRGQAYYDEQGRPFRMSGTVLDVTERKTLEDALRESESRFRQMAEAMPHIAFTARPDGTIDYVSSQWHRYSGRPRDERFGAGWLEVLHPEDHADVYQRFTQALHSGEPFEVEYRFRTSDDSYRWHLCRALPLRDRAGRIAKWVGTSTDVHEQKRLTEQLVAERSLLDAVFEGSPIGLAVVDRERRFVRVNQVLAAVDGRSPEDHVARPVAETAPILAPAIERVCDEVLATGNPLADLAASWRPAGQPAAARHWLVNGYPIRTGDGVTGIGVAVVDVSEQRRSQEALRAADRRKDEFLATLAHELRNPLNPIRSAVEILRTRAAGEPDQEWSRHVIERQLGHLTRLIDDLLDVSRISRGKLELRREPVELGEALRGAVDAVRPLVEQLGHQLSVGLPEEPLYVEGDLVRLTQVFVNLLNNAAKYTDPGGRIRLAATREGDRVVVSVRDTGVGIAPEKLPHLFEMFYQVDRSLERAQGGLGIGLSLVRQLVTMHGGRIRAQSDGMGKGAEFVVELPLRAAPQEAPQPTRVQSGGLQPSRQRRILVVDDNADSASSLALMLQLAGHEVDTAGDGEQALRKAEQSRPEVILLDLGMPKLNGYEVCRRIREQPWGRGVLLVAQTGWGQEDDLRRTREAGFDAHLVKPVEPSTLERLIDGLGAEASEEPQERVH